MIDPLTFQIFGQFPRGVGTPKRYRVSSLSDFTYFVQANNGIKDCYVDVYKDQQIDKIFIDLDVGDKPPYNYGKVLSDAQRIHKHLTELGFTVLPVVSGKKGVHLYVLLKPTKQKDPKKALASATYRIISDVFGEEKNSVDRKIIGDTNRLTRVPNTLRLDKLHWCTWLPSEFPTMNWKDVVYHSEIAHRRDIVPETSKTLEDFPPYDLGTAYTEPQSQQEMGEFTPSELSLVLRPCLAQAIRAVNPSNSVRLAVAIDLLKVKSPNDIVQIFSRLGWLDFGYHKSTYFVEGARSKCYQPFSCEKLRENGVCFYKSCEECITYQMLK